MPILFKQHQRLPSSQRYTPDRPPVRQSRRLLNAPTTAIRRLSVRLSEGRQIRAGLRRHSIRASRSARRSISRLRKHGSSIRKYFRDPKLLIQLAKYVYQRRHIKHLIPLFFVLLYMLFGAALFNWMETKAEMGRISDKNLEYERERMLFVKRMEEIVLDLAARDPAKRRAYVEEAVDHLSWKLSYELAPKEPEWSFSTSMYFAGTIFTTIGYGDVACTTQLGRLVTVLYAIFGIPLMLITWNEMGKFLYKSINEFVAALTNKCNCKAILGNIKCGKMLAKWCHCWREKGATEDNKDSSLSTDSAADIEKGMAAMMNGKLATANGYHHRGKKKGRRKWGKKEREEAAKAVSFKLSMQMQHHPEMTAHSDDEEEEEGEEEEESDEEKAKKMGKEEEDGECSEESETLYDNLALKKEQREEEEYGDDDDVDEEEEEEEEEESEQEKEESEEESGPSSSESEEVEEGGDYGFEARYGLGGMMMQEEKQGDAPRMHVLVAIGSTFAWVFLCAALFQFWEDWSYWESLYFMFISLLTIGLGDINVRRRDLMVLCFIFVIIGLSLVSMCIMVIQNSLEDLYRRILMKVLTDYQAKLKDGRRCSMGGGLKALAGSRTAKYLLPILSENTKRSVMQKVEEEARESGMHIPAAFHHFNNVNEIVDEKKELQAEMTKEVEEETIQPTAPIANGILKNAPALAEYLPSIAKSASFCGFNNREIHTQTDTIRNVEKAGQTDQRKLTNLGVQTEMTGTDIAKKKVVVDRGQQTEREQIAFKKIQTAIAKRRDAEVMTMACAGKEMNGVGIQTVGMDMEDAQVQTQTPFDLKDLFEKEVQTFKFMKSKRVQTPMPVLHDVQCQTIDTDLKGKLYPSVSMLRLFLNPIDPV